MVDNHFSLLDINCVFQFCWLETQSWCHFSLLEIIIFLQKQKYNMGTKHCIFPTLYSNLLHFLHQIFYIFACFCVVLAQQNKKIYQKMPVNTGIRNFRQKKFCKNGQKVVV